MTTLNQQWAKENYACSIPVKRFFLAYPQGLKITKANINKALTEKNVTFSSVYWILLRIRNNKARYNIDNIINIVSSVQISNGFTRSIPKQREFIKVMCKELGIK